MGLIEQFEEGTKNWEAKLQEDEWYFHNLREQITSHLRPEEAFTLISEAVDLVLQQSDEFLCSESFQLLLDLVRVTDTTELNPNLDAKWNSLCNHAAQFGIYHKNQVLELERWYRRNSP
jgi:hypothetical protein